MKTLSLLLSCCLVTVAVFGTTAGCTGTATRQSTGEMIDDTAITAKVKAALVSDDLVRARDVQVETFRGIVQLSGFVDTAEQKTQAERIASKIDGVYSVKNNITVKTTELR